MIFVWQALGSACNSGELVLLKKDIWEWGEDLSGY